LLLGPSLRVNSTKIFRLKPYFLSKLSMVEIILIISVFILKFHNKIFQKKAIWIISSGLELCTIGNEALYPI